MSQKQIEILQRALNREKEARKQAEKILEQKSAELYQVNQKLLKSNQDLETLLTRTDSQLQGVFENIVDAYVIIDLFGNILKMNDAAVSLLGFSDANEYFNLNEMVNPVDKQRVQESFKVLFEKGSLTNFQVNIITRKNESKLVHINSSIIYDQGIPVAAQGIVRDITKEKEAEEQLIESRNRLSTLLLNLDSGVLLEDENRTIVLTNNKFCDLFNISASPDKLIGENCLNSIAQSKNLFKNPESFANQINQIVQNRVAVLGDELKMINGKILERDYIPIFNNDVYKGHLWSYRDVTLKRKYRQGLEAQKQKYSSIIANMNLGLVEVDNDDKILMVNQSFLDMTGYSKEELIGYKGKDILPVQEDKAIVENKSKERKKGKTESYELRIKNKQGEIKHWLVSGAPNYNLNGDITGSIGINFDITEIKNLHIQKEHLLKKLEKSNNELQEYAHIVSHDLKSPLRSIYALVSWLKEDNKDKLDQTSLKNFNLIETSLERMEQLITDILDYSSAGADVIEKENVDIHQLVGDLKQILFVPENIKIDILNKLPVVLGDKTKLQQLFQNLISNAVKFIDKEEGYINIDVTEQETCYQFSISDNGIGIEKQYHEKIFKIFHALNKSKDSTGIGLSIVKKIVNLHEGNIWLESEPGIGSTFYFTIKK
ncbi:PAS domain S-box protein [Mesoflavibacter zeaxanthinifaciens]|uniref:PAS domain S-box protein n=1 Tax=Mesoflavibacter zeaxanthinifaciens TaxID=393060 RepID=UPI003A8CAB77